MEYKVTKTIDVQNSEASNFERFEFGAAKQRDMNMSCMRCLLWEIYERAFNLGYAAVISVLNSEMLESFLLRLNI